MSEEFKPIRITLSDEAFYRLDKIMNDARFRSYSSTIEECIRAVYDITNEIYAITGKKKGEPITSVTLCTEDVGESWIRIMMRMNRFTNIRPILKPEKKET